MIECNSCKLLSLNLQPYGSYCRHAPKHIPNFQNSFLPDNPRWLLSYMSFHALKMSMPVTEFTIIVNQIDLYQLYLKSQCKTFSVNKIRKSTKVFSQMNSSFATSCKCLGTHFGHMTKMKTSLNLTCF